MTTKYLILCALERELPIQKNPYKRSTFYTGVGKVNAAIRTLELISELQPEVIINYGTAGSLDTNLSGLIECGAFFDRDDVSKFTSSGRIITQEDSATISTGDNFVTQGDLDCDLVDMEAYVIASICKNNKIDFKCLKYVTDYVGSNSVSEWEHNVSKGYPSFIEWMKKFLEANNEEENMVCTKRL